MDQQGCILWRLRAIVVKWEVDSGNGNGSSDGAEVSPAAGGAASGGGGGGGNGTTTTFQYSESDGLRRSLLTIFSGKLSSKLPLEEDEKRKAFVESLLDKSHKCKRICESISLNNKIIKLMRMLSYI